MYSISTLAALRRHLGLSDSDTSEDARLRAALVSATAAIERRSARRYLPYQATRLHSLNLSDVGELLLDGDLLELTELINGDGQVLALDDVLLLAGGILRLTNGAAFTYSESPQDAITVSGWWGYHPQPERAWQHNVDSVQTALTSSATTLEVASVTGDEPHFAGFEVGQVLRLEDELVIVLAHDSLSQTLTLERGALGSSASAHAVDTPIALYQPPADVALLTVRWAAWLYREPDSALDDVPPALVAALDGLRRITVRP